MIHALFLIEIFFGKKNKIGLFIQPKANENHDDVYSESSQTKTPATPTPGNGGMVLVRPGIHMKNEDNEN